jgi:hypothetical protein
MLTFSLIQSRYLLPLVYSLGTLPLPHAHDLIAIHPFELEHGNYFHALPRIL